MTEHLPPAGLNIRGTVLVVPGRGESPLSYARFGRRLAADAYHVRVLQPPTITAGDLEGTLNSLDAALTAAVQDLPSPPARPLVLTGSDTGAALLAALLSGPGSADSPTAPLAVTDGADRSSVPGTVASPAAPPPGAGGADLSSGAPAGSEGVSSPAAEARAARPWLPDAVVLAGLPGHDRRHEGAWEDELDVRSHCPVHRGVLSDDAAVTPGTLAEAAAPELLEAAYASASPVPHLLLVGEADPFADRDSLAGLAKSLPTARLATVRGAHHDVLNDVSHRSVAAEIVSFLEAVRDGVPPRPFVRTESSAW
jgi:alpha-beta hydrolase superfamily lysophospholipase